MSSEAAAATAPLLLLLLLLAVGGPVAPLPAWVNWLMGWAPCSSNR
jgi:hypothetical protein